MVPKFNIVVAYGIDRIIAVNNTIPWESSINPDIVTAKSADRQFFKKITMNGTVIVGRKTYDDLPFKEFPGRKTIVVSRNSAHTSTSSSVTYAQTIEDALRAAVNDQPISIIGGGEIYNYACTTLRSHINCIYTTQFNIDYRMLCPDSRHMRFPHIDPFLLTKADPLMTVVINNPNTRRILGGIGEANTVVSHTAVQRMKNFEEQFGYCRLVNIILDSGTTTIGRNGSTMSVFSPPAMRYNLANGFPLLTTKKMPFRLVIEELLWFISGATSCKPLQDKNIHIWDGNSSREFLDGRGFNDRPVGEIGPMYGFQWRNFGGKYPTTLVDNTGGVDQLAELIAELRADLTIRKHNRNLPPDDEPLPNPNARRHMLTAWNPLQLPDMALPPCHVMTQFSIEEIIVYSSHESRHVVEYRLSAHLYQRSGDVGLGVPFNIASYSALIHIIAAAIGCCPGYLTHTIGDAHIYVDHVDALYEQVCREPLPFPTMLFTPAMSNPTTIEPKKFLDLLDISQFEIIGYSSHPAVKMDMIS